MSTKVSALTQATNSELAGASLAYIVTDPSGTPASKKSTLARLGMPAVSFIEEFVAFYGLGAIQTQDITLGCAFFSVRSGQTCTGVRINWNSTNVATLKLALYAGTGGGALASVNITTTGTAGYYSGIFGSAVSLSRNVCYIASCYNTAGNASQLGETSRVVPQGASGVFPLAPGQRFRDYVLAADGKYIGGDGNPQGNTNTQVLYPVEPLISG